MKLSSIILEKKISLSYVEGGNRLYSISIDGQKQRHDDQKAAMDMIEKITGLEVPKYSEWDSDEVLNIITALREKGYDAQSYPMDVS
jgi:hypothetical protein|tara:strand:+ start:107 stop:367 length:261 start_codon:yes stop_codon:yes gene_type:complete